MWNGNFQDIVAAAPQPGMCTAAADGSTDKVRQLLADGKNIEEKGGVKDSTPLHYASVSGEAAVVVLLLEHKADVSAKTKFDESTPLHLAAVQGHEKIVLLLLEHKADISAQTGEDSTPLHLAAFRGRQAGAFPFCFLPNGLIAPCRWGLGPRPARTWRL